MTFNQSFGHPLMEFLREANSSRHDALLHLNKTSFEADDGWGVWFNFICTTLSNVVIKIVVFLILHFIYTRSPSSIVHPAKFDYSPAARVKVIQQLLALLLFIQLPCNWMSAVAIDKRNEWRNLPPLPFILFHIAFILVVSDLCHYFLHRLVHAIPFFYQFHKVHHEFQVPFAMVENYSHPIDFCLIAILPFSIAEGLLDTFDFEHCHLFMHCISGLVANVHSISQHSNLQLPLPWSPLHLIPFGNSDEFHLLHHAKFNANFGEFFTLWDRVCGTAYDEGKAPTRIDKTK